MTPRHLLLACLALLASAQSGWALGMESFGPTAKLHQPTAKQPDWPTGMIGIVDHESRVYSQWVNGSESYYFHLAPNEIAELLQRFSAVRLRDHVVTIKPGPQEAQTFRGQRVPYNVAYNYLGGISRMMVARGGKPTTHEPTLVVIVDPQANRDWWDAAEIPENLIVRSEVEGWPAGGVVSPPERQLWHARVKFKDETPAANFELGVSTRVTLWEEGGQSGIYLGKVNHEGRFSAAFSDAEIDRLKSGQMWLTMTVGNSLVAPLPDHPRLGVDALALDPADATVVTVTEPNVYYGRVLFEDGAPSILSPAPWPGAKVSVSFPYAGQAEIDDQGYFRVSLAPNQLQDLMTRRDRKNVYLPNDGEKNTSKAVHTFPAGKLSPAKQQAGEIRIPRPQPAGP